MFVRYLILLKNITKNLDVQAKLKARIKFEINLKLNSIIIKYVQFENIFLLKHLYTVI
jgi:hypothetical protein